MSLNQVTTVRGLSTIHIVTLLSAPGIGRSVVQKLLTANIAFTPSGPRDLRKLLLQCKTRSSQIYVPTDSEMEKACAHAERLLERAQRMGMTVLTPNTPSFPARLRAIPDPPVVLYATGDIHHTFTAPAVAIIGTRQPSPFGVKSAYKIAGTLASNGFIIVSGLALGIDTAAHRGCIDAGGHTVAVLAHGLDQIYPPGNAALAGAILESGGCLLSEYPPGVHYCRDFFIARDRLQSGLSNAVIVAETGLKGGTMHTVRFCLQQRRPLGCIAHPEKFAKHQKAMGNKKLIVDGKAVALPNKEAIEEFLSSLPAGH